MTNAYRFPPNHDRVKNETRIPCKRWPTPIFFSQVQFDIWRNARESKYILR